MLLQYYHTDYSYDCYFLNIKSQKPSTKASKLATQVITCANIIYNLYTAKELIAPTTITKYCKWKLMTNY